MHKHARKLTYLQKCIELLGDCSVVHSMLSVSLHSSCMTTCNMVALMEDVMQEAAFFSWKNLGSLLSEYCCSWHAKSYTTTSGLVSRNRRRKPITSFLPSFVRRWNPTRRDMHNRQVTKQSKYNRAAEQAQKLTVPLILPQQPCSPQNMNMPPIVPGAELNAGWRQEGVGVSYSFAAK